VSASVAAAPARPARGALGYRLPVMPVLTWSDLAPGRRARRTGVLDVGRPVWLSSGSAALHAALELAGARAGDDVLVPAFNCPAMVAPIERVGARPVFYALDADFRITRERLIASATPRIKAALVPHLFGRLQDLAPIREWCDAQRVVLIEDCAHALFGARKGTTVGTTGDYAIASPRKFLPGAEGGLLTSATRSLAGLRAAAPSWLRGLRVGFDTLDAAVASRKLRGVAPLIRLAKGFKTRAPADAEPAPAPAPTSASPESPPAAAWPTRLVCSLALRERALMRRLANYWRLVEAVHGLPGLRVLNAYDRADESVVPYMLPLLLADPAVQFARLKAAGVPVWRWEYSRRGVCPVTDRYADALIQIPCHQSLDESELDWLAQQLRAAASDAR
jgi:perosamine synthetase